MPLAQGICLQCRRPGFNPWVRKIPRRRGWQPTPVFLPGESHGQRNLVAYSPWSHKELDPTKWLNTFFCFKEAGTLLDILKGIQCPVFRAAFAFWLNIKRAKQTRRWIKPLDFFPSPGQFHGPGQSHDSELPQHFCCNHGTGRPLRLSYLTPHTEMGHNRLQLRTSLVAQWKRILQYRKLRFNPWVGKTPWRRKMTTHSSIPA